MDLRDSAIKKHLFREDSPCYEKDEKNDNLLDCYHGINPYGPCEAVEKALKEGSNEKFELHRYAIHRKSELKTRIEEKWMNETGENIEGRICMSNGAKTVLENVNQMVLEEGEKVTGVAPQYTNYIQMVRSLAATYDPVELREEENLRFPLTRFINKVMKERPAMVYLDNPNNPTGQFLDKDSVREIVSAADSVNTLVLVDEAYGGFIDRNQSAVNLTSEFNNLIVARSFSKAHGLAGARAGYMVGSKDLMEYYRRVRTPYKMSSIAIQTAKLALENEEYLGECRKKLKNGQQRIINAIDCRVMETSLDTPIFTIKSENTDDLWRDMKEAGIRVNSGENFLKLDSSYVRVRTPERPGEFLMKYNRMRREKKTKVLEKNA